MLTDKFIQLTYRGVNAKVLPQPETVSEVKSYEFYDCINNFGWRVYAPDLDNLLLWWQELIDYGLDNKIDFLDHLNVSFDETAYPKVIFEGLISKYSIGLY